MGLTKATENTGNSAQDGIQLSMNVFYSSWLIKKRPLNFFNAQIEDLSKL